VKGVRKSGQSARAAAATPGANGSGHGSGAHRAGGAMANGTGGYPAWLDAGVIFAPPGRVNRAGDGDGV
jgi:hypothetical protein